MDATSDNLYDLCVLAEKLAGRQQALDEAIENIKQEEIDYKTVVLNKLGITDEKEVNALLDLEVDEGDVDVITYDQLDYDGYGIYQ